ncbi:hypothetical protein BsWGS_11855 [Bradybaena similaris]
MPLSQVSLQRTPTPGDSLRRRKAEDARLELIADIWEQVRAEVLQERLQQLSQKVILQRELISAHDQRAQLIRRQEEEAKVKKRTEEKTKKQEVLAGLQEKCKQSLELDRETKSQSLASKKSALSTNKPTVLKGNEDTSEKSTYVSRSFHSNSSSLRTHIPTISSTQEVENEDDVTNGNEHGQDRRVEGTPPTSQNTELFKLYAHNAGKYSNASKLLLKKIPRSNLKKFTGHLSASQIWTTLWSDSVSKLLQADDRFPKDLKETFSAHVRQGIAKFKKPVSRSFTRTQDVPDLESLMDKSKLHHVRALRHKTQLMYRASLVNQDRTRILLFNNHPPSFGEEDEGIARFLPPCEDTDSVCTEASYLRWIKGDQCLERGDSNEISTDVERKRQPSLLSADVERKRQPSLLSGGWGVNQDLEDIWESIMMRQKPKKEPRYHFLTEKEAQTPGAFRARLSMDKTKSAGDLDLVSREDKCLVSWEDKGLESWEDKGMSHSREGSASQMHPAERLRFESSWEPLSLHALSEYKKQLSTEGQGEFQHGRPPMWNKLTS